MKTLRGFTLAEVLITLIVIGIVASATIPMLNNNVADKKWNIAKQKARATIGEAFRLMSVNGEITTTKSDGTTMTTADFVNTVIPKYLKIEKTCAPNDYAKCGFPSKVQTPGGAIVNLTPNDYKWSELSNGTVWNASSTQPKAYSSWNNRFTKTYTAKYGTTYNTSYFFRTLDGFSVAFLYNPYCAIDKLHHYILFYQTPSGVMNYHQQAMDVICLMGIYDMNGKSGPNKVGMDIGFVGSFYNGFETTSAAVLPHSVEKKYNENGLTGTTKFDKLNNYCKNLGKNNDWIMPDLDELSILYLNYRLVGDGKSKYVDRNFLSRVPVTGEKGLYWCVGFDDGGKGARVWDVTGEDSYAAARGPHVRCVRNTALK